MVLLKNQKNLLCFYDEANSFMGSLGRYNGGENYERSLFLTLFNAPPSMDRDLKSGRVRLFNPRLNMCLAGHPYSFIEMLQRERKTYDDGLMQRFLICAPLPKFFETDILDNIPKRKYSISSILYTIYTLHIDDKQYEMDEEAVKCFKEYFDLNKNLVKLSNNKDIFLR